MQALTKMTLTLFVVLFLAGCGGGSGDGTDLVSGDIAGEDAAADSVSSDLSSEDGYEDSGDVTMDTDESDVTLPPATPMVIAVISDTHLWGGLEHTITKRFSQCLTTVASLEPTPEALFVTGDLIDSIPDSFDLPEGPLAIFAQLMDQSEVPLYPVAGNHDYYATQSPQYLLADSQGPADEAREAILGTKPYYSVMLNGINFVMLNSMQGPMWDISMGLSGSFGLPQLEWLEGELSKGAPTLLFMHHPPTLNEEEEGQVTIEEIIQAHSDSIIAVFAGHLHLWSRGEVGGVPVCLTAANKDGVQYHHVRVNPETLSVEILNEADIDYGELEATQCHPDKETPVADLSPFADTVHHLLINDTVAEPGAFGEYIEEGIRMMPLMIRFEAPPESGVALPGVFTVGTYTGNQVGSLPPYIEVSDGAPCLHLDIHLDNPCFLSQPVHITMDIARAIGIYLQPEWNMRVLLTDLQIQGVAAVSGKPKLTKGQLTMGLDFSMTIDDLQSIIITEYCAGDISGCSPGTGDMPSCPGTPTVEFFPQIPTSCDVNVIGFGVRMFLAMLGGVPDARGSVHATFETWSPEASETPKAGAYVPDLFLPAGNPNCQWNQ